MINLKIKELDGRVIRDTKRKKASFIYENTQLHLTLLKEKKVIRNTIICFCRRKLNKGKLDQINPELAQISYSDYWGPNRTIYFFWDQLDIVCLGFQIRV
jgi:hypothetical protein